MYQQIFEEQIKEFQIIEPESIPINPQALQQQKIQNPLPEPKILEILQEKKQSQPIINVKKNFVSRRSVSIVHKKYDKIQNTKKVSLPSITKSSMLIRDRRHDNQKQHNQTIKKDHQNVKNDLRFMFRPSKSVQAQKPKQITLKDQFYLPAFIRNFQLPPKQKKQVIPTMSIFKKREIILFKFLSSLQKLKEYKILSQIGKGSFSTVSQAKNIETNKKYAIKTYTKLDQIEQFKFINIEREIENMFKVNEHKNVVQIQAVVIQKRKILIIMENCGQQSFAGIMRKRKMIPQNEVKYFFRQIIEGINYCHQKGICHRDLKLQNILLDDQNHVKIIDFGFSCTSNRLLNSFCGTPPYMPPEIVSKGLYEGKSADIWSLGVILYVMLYGTFPFKSTHQNELFRLIQQGKIHHNQTITSDAKDIISNMLNINVQARCKAEKILQHKWLNN